ncbi:unnamed protein product [Vitrella brassicaformis CCMP3155]|uniref:Uncharacterized protein n=2 Tax=Vitrella brassicaformis TaxID=1169539 RepID=A0A0G4ED08_VITBC|nr:unnamed protein product [Vitrella brassicaformis CCMP3155]|mmetsp:Transcript_13430/g.32070  ORF Transcript_13430/g.32070 Transcript_13430/m.32070 type:complete len:206 (+) Transcript_13430:178-795(+)|eukprot:CEL93880.1 unnamed protein product [Vitrella brassicaformis CCMP3155]
MSIRLEFRLRFYDNRPDERTFQRLVNLPNSTSISFRRGILRSELQRLLKAAFAPVLDGYSAALIKFPDHPDLTADDVTIDANSFPGHGGEGQPSIRVEAGVEGLGQPPALRESDAARKQRRVGCFYLWMAVLFLAIAIVILATSGQTFHGVFWSGVCLAVALMFVALRFAIGLADRIDRCAESRCGAWLLDCPDCCGCFREPEEP